MLYCDVLPSPVRLYPPTRLCQDENLLAVNFVDFLTKRKKLTKRAKKII